jgi:ZIP family zinc transporter
MSAGQAARGEEKKQLMHMGAATAITIALHNLNEGLGRILLDSWKTLLLALVLLFGIAIHNISEGLGVSMPNPYATGHRWRAFFWRVLSRLTESLEALIGWAVFNTSFGGNAHENYFWACRRNHDYCQFG